MKRPLFNKISKQKRKQHKACFNELLTQILEKGENYEFDSKTEQGQSSDPGGNISGNMLFGG